MKKNRSIFVLLAISVLISACNVEVDNSTTDGATPSSSEGSSGRQGSSAGDNGESDSDEGGSPGASQGSSPSPAGSEVPPSVQSLLDRVCQERPPLSDSISNIQGRVERFREYLHEQDEGSHLQAGNKFFANGSVSTLYIEPSEDGTVTWAARKWSIGPTQQEADEAMKNIKIESSVESETAKLTVDHPSSTMRGARYQVCAVARAPKNWVHDLRPGSGSLESIDHEGPLYIDMESGSLRIEKKGEGLIEYKKGSGSVEIVHQGSGSLKGISESGDSTIELDSRVSFDISQGSGSFDLTLLDGGVPLQGDSFVDSGSGSIYLHIASTVGLVLDAELETGSISAPPSYPLPTELTSGGESLISTLQGGGARLEVRGGSGSLHISDWVGQE